MGWENGQWCPLSELQLLIFTSILVRHLERSCRGDFFVLWPSLRLSIADRCSGIPGESIAGNRQRKAKLGEKLVTGLGQRCDWFTVRSLTPFGGWNVLEKSDLRRKGLPRPFSVTFQSECPNFPQRSGELECVASPSGWRLRSEYVNGRFWSTGAVNSTPQHNDACPC